MPRGAGFEFHEKVVGGAVPRNYLGAVEEGVVDSLVRGPLGFPVIDIHTHSDFTLPLNPKAESKIRQGVTTEVVGNCGFSVAPALPGSTKSARTTVTDEYAGVVVPLRFVTDAGTLSLFSTTTIFGTPVDVTLSELAIESFFPADAATGETLRRLAASSPPRERP